MTLYTDNRPAQIGITVTFSILVTTDLIGNTLVILVILTNKSMRQPMNYLLVNLAIADMMVASFIAPRFIFSHFFTHPDGLAGTLLCKLLTGGSFTWIGGAVSVFSLVAIAFERYFAVMYPHTLKFRLTNKKLKVIIIAAWTFGVMLNIPLILTIFYSKKRNLCIEYWPDPVWLPKAYSTVWLIVAGLVPISIMFILYFRVISNLWFKRSAENIEGTQLAVLKSRKRITKMVIAVSVIYGLCWLPHLSNYALNYYHPNYTYGDVTCISSMVLVTFNSTVNPFVYALQSERFRCHLKELICCRKMRSNRVDTHSNITTHKSRADAASDIQNVDRRVGRN